MEQSARSLVKILNDAGYIAFYAGGWVRDLVMGNHSSDVDIATNASPEKIMEIFPKTIPVGISFGVIIVLHQGHTFEVSTFRKDRIYIDGRHPEGIDLSTPEEDAKRRDFTINGMFYDPLNDHIIDYVGGKSDIESKTIRTIGDADLRFTEDRLRMVRAIRFATRFDFNIEKNTKKAILSHAPFLFPAVSMERIWQELSKMSKSFRFDQALVNLHELKLLQEILPSLAQKNSLEIAKCCETFKLFPSNAPTICYLLELFPESELSFKVELCHRLKATHADVKLVEFFHFSNELLNKYLNKEKVERTEWAHFFSHQHSWLALKIYLTKFNESERLFLETYFLNLNESLKLEIERIHNHLPVLSSQHLLKCGLKPGKIFGVLLNEGEKIAINEGIEDSTVILDRLKNSAFWPEN